MGRGMLVMMVACAAVVFGCGEKGKSLQSCVAKWNVDTAARELARHAYEAHGVRRAETKVRGVGKVRGAVCSVTFVAAPYDPEFGELGMIDTGEEWLELMVLPRAMRMQLQSRASSEENSYVFPDGTLALR